MEKSLSSLRRSLSVFFFVSIALFIAFLTIYLIYPLYQLADGYEGVASNLVIDIVNDKNLPSIAAYFGAPFSGSGTVETMSIVFYVAVGVVLVLTVLGIVYVCKKGKGIFSLYVFMLLVALYAGFVSSIYGLKLFDPNFDGGLELFNHPETVNTAIFRTLVFALGVLFFVLVIVVYVLGLVYARKLEIAAALQEEEDAKVIAEAAGDPEAVQESEELNAPAEALVVESEPEPVTEEAPVEVEEAVEAAEPVEEFVEPVEEFVEPVEEAAEEPLEEPVEESTPADEPKIEEEPKEDNQHVEVNVNNNAGPQQSGFDQASLASLLREVVRDIVRDEIARNNLNQPQQPAQQAPNGNQTITGATFGGPLVVQYFNGGINGVSQPAPAPAPQVVEKVVEVHKEEPKPEPAPAPAPVVEVKEEPKPEPVTEPVKEEVKPEPAPAPVVEVKPEPRPLFVKKEPAPVAEGQPEPKKYERISFAERLLKSESDVQNLYNEIKNEILSYGVKSRISAVGDTFRLHKKMYVRITVAGKSLKLYFALNPMDYANGTIPVQDASDKDMYQEIPLVFKVKSALSVRRCKELIQDVMEKDGLEQGEIGKVNWIKELKAEMKNSAKKEKE